MLALEGEWIWRVGRPSEFRRLRALAVDAAWQRAWIGCDLGFGSVSMANLAAPRAAVGATSGPVDHLALSPDEEQVLLATQEQVQTWQLAGCGASALVAALPAAADLQGLAWTDAGPCILDGTGLQLWTCDLSRTIASTGPLIGSAALGHGRCVLAVACDRETRLFSDCLEPIRTIPATGTPRLLPPWRSDVLLIEDALVTLRVTPRGDCGPARGRCCGWGRSGPLMAYEDGSVHVDCGCGGEQQVTSSALTSAAKAAAAVAVRSPLEHSRGVFLLAP